MIKVKNIRKKMKTINNYDMKRKKKICRMKSSLGYYKYILLPIFDWGAI